jgi:hypothetical protein
MTDRDDQTRFQIQLPGFELSIAGERADVERLYHLVSQDIVPLLSPGRQPLTPAKAPRQPPTYTWVYSCTDFYSKVYAVDDEQLRAGLLGRFVDPKRLRRIYVARDDSDLFTRLAGTQTTLWAEFTESGRRHFQQ